MINSPRSLQACFKLGIDTSELYQITMDEFKELNPDVRHLPQDMIQFRYDAEEKYRNDSIEQVKEERKKIIEENKEKENAGQGVILKNNNHPYISPFISIGKRRRSPKRRKRYKRLSM